MLSLKFYFMVLAIIATTTTGQIVNVTDDNNGGNAYLQTLVTYFQTVNGNFQSQIKNLTAFANTASDFLENIDFETLLEGIEFLQARNLSFNGIESDNLDTLYNILKFLQFISTIDNRTSTLPSITEILTSIGSGFTGNAEAVVQQILQNITSGFQANMPNILSTIIGNNTNNLAGLLQSMNISTFSFNPAAMLEELNVSSVCMGHLQQTMTALTEGSMWALQMFDSMGKPKAGFLEGNLFWPGTYDQCMDIAVIDSATGLSPFSTRHCMVNIPISIQGINAQIRVGMCVPDTCGERDILILINTLFALIPSDGTPTVAAYTTCSLTEKVYDAKAIAALCICGFFVALMAAATVFDIMYSRRMKQMASKSVNKLDTEESEKPEPTDDVDEIKSVAFPNMIYKINCEMYKNPTIEDYVPKIISTKQPEKDQIAKAKDPHSLTGFSGVLAKLLLSFSVWTNGKKLLSSKQSGALGAVNGIRFLSMTWVILGHTFVFSINFVQNITFFQKLLPRWTFMVILNALLSVDTFFAMSGLLVSYVFMKEMKKEKGRINWFVFYFHRFWRLTPPYMLMMMINVTLSRYFGNGPSWPKDGLEVNYCKKSWWTNLLYVNNFVHMDEMCFGWAWYLANDMQFYILSPLMLVPLFFWRKIGMVICGVFLLGVTITTAVITVEMNIPTVLFSLSPVPVDTVTYFQTYYIKPYCRMGPYIIGLITGYVLYQKGLKVKINKYMNFFIWIVATVVACLCLYGIYEPSNGDFMEPGLAALYNATSRTLWGACVCWVIFACATGNGGYVNTLLSWKPFIPLGRLTYCAYLVHPILIYTNYYQMRKHIYATDLAFIYYFLGYLVASYAVAFVVSLAFESPMMGIEKVIFRRGQSKAEKKK